MEITLRDKKIMKMGRAYGVTINKAYIDNGQIDVTRPVTVTFSQEDKPVAAVSLEPVQIAG